MEGWKKVNEQKEHPPGFKNCIWGHSYTCPDCGYKTGNQAAEFYFCPRCGKLRNKAGAKKYLKSIGRLYDSERLSELSDEDSAG